MSEPPTTPAATISGRTVRGAAVAAFAAVLGFAIFTGQAWEDYYITFRSSRHLAEGHGLVYQIGERVHTFTSPLGVLLPALGFALTGNDEAALWFLRVVSALALAGTAALVMAHARDHGWPRSAAWGVVILGVLEAKIVAFSANGMETAVLMLFAALAWRELTRPGGPRWPWLALAYGGLMWTRPDAFVVAGAMTAALWVFGPHRLTADERTWWRQLGPAVLIGGLIYVPWFLWAWRYYGSPVPQTIIAKSALTPGGLSLSRILLAPWSCLTSNTALDGLFLPIYSGSGGWPAALVLTGRLLARLAAFLWLLPFLPRGTRAASLAVLAGGIYFHQINPYPWYFAPWTLLGALALSGAGWTVLGRLPGGLRPAGRIAAGIIAGGMLAVTGAQAYSAREQQQLVENNGRKQIGLWLREHAAPTDSVFLEPIGYIGYFSQLKILDYPGLCAPEVSRIIRSGPGGYAKIITTLRPTWLVLRPVELTSQGLVNSMALDNYVVAGVWSQRPRIDAVGFLPGRNWLEFDAEFMVLHRIEKPAAK